MRKAEAITITGNESLDELMADFERQVINTTLEQNRYNISKTAEQLKISRHALRYRMQRLNISMGADDETPPPPGQGQGRLTAAVRRRFVMTQQSRTITRKSASNLALAFVLLPKPKRDAMSALYAFCREVDDVADEETAPVEKRRAASGRLARGCPARLRRRRARISRQSRAAAGHRPIPPALQLISTN